MAFMALSRDGCRFALTAALINELALCCLP